MKVRKLFEADLDINKWKERMKKKGAVKFENKYPDIIAKDKDDKDVGFWDGTDSTGTADDD